MSSPALGDIAPALEAWAPFLQDGTKAQDIAMVYALPYHSLMMSALWSPLGLSAMLIGLIILLVRLFAAPGIGAWTQIVGFMLVVVFAWPVSDKAAESWMFHENFASSTQGVSKEDYKPKYESEQRVALGIVASMYVINAIEDVLFKVVNIETETNDPAPMAMFQAMNVNYYKMFEEPSLLAPIEDYYRNCAYLRNSKELQGSITDEEWHIYGLGGIPTFGYDVSAADAKVVDSYVANSALGRWLPGVQSIAKGVYTAQAWVAGRDGAKVKAVLANTNPNRAQGLPINQDPYHILAADYWRDRARSDGAQAINKVFRAKSDPDAELAIFEHPQALATGQLSPAIDLYADNCLELFQIADIAVREMRKGSRAAFHTSYTDVLSPRALSVYGASNFGVMRAMQNIASNIQTSSDVFSKTEPNRRRIGGNKSATTSAGEEAVGAIVAGVRDVGLWSQLVIKLPDVVMMAIGATALLIAIIVVVMPILLLVGIALGTASVVLTPLRAIIMLKLTLFLMFLFLNMGAGFLEAVTMYWNYSQMVDQVNVYPMAPLFYAAHNGTLLLAMAAPPVLAYMLAFGSTREFNKFSPGRAGAGNLASGIATGAAVGTVVAGAARGGKVIGALSSAIGKSGSTTAAARGAAGNLGFGGGGGPNLGGGGPWGPLGGLPGSFGQQMQPKALPPPKPDRRGFREVPTGQGSGSSSRNSGSSRLSPDGAVDAEFRAADSTAPRDSSAATRTPAAASTKSAAPSMSGSPSGGSVRAARTAAARRGPPRTGGAARAPSPRSTTSAGVPRNEGVVPTGSDSRSEVAAASLKTGSSGSAVSGARGRADPNLQAAPASGGPGSQGEPPRASLRPSAPNIDRLATSAPSSPRADIRQSKDIVKDAPKGADKA